MDNEIRQVDLIASLEARNQEINISPFERERESHTENFEINAFVGREKMKDLRSKRDNNSLNPSKITSNL
jgi:hypothetical protein